MITHQRQRALRAPPLGSVMITSASRTIYLTHKKSNIQVINSEITHQRQQALRAPPLGSVTIISASRAIHPLAPNT